MRKESGAEEESQPKEVLKNFGKEFTRLKIQNHREFGFEKEAQDSEEKVLLTKVDKEHEVLFNDRGRSFQRNSKFIRSKSNPKFYRQARSQSWNNARSQSRSRPNQRYEKIQGTRYWNNREEEGKGYGRNEAKLDEILKSVKKVAENCTELNKRVETIEDKMKNVNYCEEEIREVHFSESDKVDYEIIIDSGCPKTLASEKIVESYIEKHGLKRKDLGRKECAMMFKFGSSRYPSHETLKIPVKLPTKNVDGDRDSFYAMIETYVVKGDVPYLLGDNTLAEWKSKIDVSERALEIHKYKDDRGCPVLLDAPLKGSHMKIEMQSLKEKNLKELVMFIEEVFNSKIATDFKSIRKIHERLNHKSKENLLHAFANADLMTKEVKETIGKVIEHARYVKNFGSQCLNP